MILLDRMSSLYVVHDNVYFWKCCYNPPFFVSIYILRAYLLSPSYECKAVCYIALYNCDRTLCRSMLDQASHHVIGSTHLLYILLDMELHRGG
jgi:hypothetical protein